MRCVFPYAKRNEGHVEQTLHLCILWTRKFEIASVKGSFFVPALAFGAKAASLANSAVIKLGVEDKDVGPMVVVKFAICSLQSARAGEACYCLI